MFILKIEMDYKIRFKTKSNISIDFKWEDKERIMIELGDTYRILLKGTSQLFESIMQSYYDGIDVEGIIGILDSRNGDRFLLRRSNSLFDVSYSILGDSGKVIELIS